MNTAQARDAADSVWRYVARTAIRDAGGCRWPTLDYDNTLKTDLPTVFNGAGGIALFLADYAKETGTPAAEAMAGDALRWAEPAARPWGTGFSFGLSGIGWAWLRYAAAFGAGESLERAKAIGVEAVADVLDPDERGVCTDTMGGVTGVGELALALHAATGHDVWRDHAARIGAWLDNVKIEMHPGIAWPMHAAGPPSRIFWGGAHGAAGIVRFIAGLARATRDDRWVRLAADAGLALERAAVEIHGGLNWPRGPGMPELKCQWCHGAPGVGLALVALFEATNDRKWLEIAARAGDAVVGYGDIRKNPCWCHGLSGNAELLIELHRVTNDGRWLDRALAFGGMALAYRVDDAQGERWEADDPGKYSPDFMCGASGAGHVFLRLASAGRLPMALP